jgi:hypothetical protein
MRMLAGLLVGMALPAMAAADEVTNPTVKSYRVTGPSPGVSMEVKNYGPGIGDPTYYVLLYQQLNNVDDNEILYVTARAQITNNLGYNVELQCSLKWTTSVGNTTGTAVTPESGFNVSPDMNHGIIEISAAYDVPADSSSMSMSLVCYAGGGSESEMGDTVLVQPNYGYLHILRFTPP